MDKIVSFEAARIQRDPSKLDWGSVRRSFPAFSNLSAQEMLYSVIKKNRDKIVMLARLNPVKAVSLICKFQLSDPTLIFVLNYVAPGSSPDSWRAMSQPTFSIDPETLSMVFCNYQSPQEIGNCINLHTEAFEEFSEIIKAACCSVVKGDLSNNGNEDKKDKSIRSELHLEEEVLKLEMKLKRSKLIEAAEQNGLSVGGQDMSSSIAREILKKDVIRFIAEKCGFLVSFQDDSYLRFDQSAALNLKDAKTFSQWKKAVFGSTTAKVEVIILYMPNNDQKLIDIRKMSREQNIKDAVLPVLGKDFENVDELAQSASEVALRSSGANMTAAQRTLLQTMHMRLDEGDYVKRTIEEICVVNERTTDSARFNMAISMATVFCTFIRDYHIHLHESGVKTGLGQRKKKAWNIVQYFREVTLERLNSIPGAREISISGFSVGNNDPYEYRTMTVEFKN